MISPESGGKKKTRQMISLGVVLVLLIVASMLPKVVAGYTVVLFATFIVYMVMSVSWTLFSGPTGYMSLATAAFYGVGIYVSAMFGGSVPLPVLMLIGGAASFIIAFIIGAITLRLRGVYFTIFSFALVKLLESLINWLEIRISGVRGHHVTSGIARADLNNTVFYYLLGTLALLLLVAYIIRHSRFGRALTAIGESEDAAAHIGINTTVFKILGFAISAFFVGCVGSAWALKLGYIDSGIAFNANMSFLPILMAIFGGIGVLPGPVIGAAVFAYITEILSTRFPTYSMIGTGVVMVVAILFLPNGIFGLAQKGIKNIKLRGTKKGANT